MQKVVSCASREEEMHARVFSVAPTAMNALGSVVFHVLHDVVLQASKLLPNEAPVAHGLLDESVHTVNEIVYRIF